MAGKLKIYMGLPGSGKSTLANAEMEADVTNNTVIVNRDNLRTELFGEEYHNSPPDKDAEKKVSKIQEQRILAGLFDGKCVINDDTNLNLRTLDYLADLADRALVTYEITQVNVPLDVVFERNKSRAEKGGRFVPESVIYQMYRNSHNPVTGEMNKVELGKDGFAYVSEFNGRELINMYNKSLSWRNPRKNRGVVIVDVDGTLANNGHDVSRLLNHPKKKRDFEAFFKSIKRAPVNYDVRDLANKMHDEDDLNIIVLTGRSGGFGDELIHFIERSGLKLMRLIANDSEDRDHIFKKREIAKLRQEGFVIVAAIDDRPVSVDMWREEGVHVEVVEHYDLPFDPKNASKPYPNPKIDSIYGTGVCLRCGKPLSDPSENIGKICATKI